MAVVHSGSSGVWRGYAVFDTVEIKKLNAIVRRNSFVPSDEVGESDPILDVIQNTDNFIFCPAFHVIYFFFPCHSLSQYQKAVKSFSLAAVYSIHFPVTISVTLQDFLIPFLYRLSFQILVGDILAIFFPLLGYPIREIRRVQIKEHSTMYVLV